MSEGTSPLKERTPVGSEAQRVAEVGEDLGTGDGAMSSRRRTCATRSEGRYHGGRAPEGEHAVTTTAAATTFADARQMHAAALARLDAGDIRDAAEKAWGATLRATNALILTRTGAEPEKSPATSAGLNALASQDPAVRTLVGRYYSRQSQLHGECFYLGLCDPVPETERRIRETAEYIDDAEVLANSDR